MALRQGLAFGFVVVLLLFVLFTIPATIFAVVGHAFILVWNNPLIALGLIILAMLLIYYLKQKC
jgi:hypothetical protein